MWVIILAVVVVAIAVVVQVIVMVPVVLHFKKTLSANETFVKSMEASLKVLIDDEVRPAARLLHATLQEVEGVAKGAREGVEKIDETLEAFRKVGETVRSVNSVLEQAVRSPVINAAAWVTGVKVGLGTLVGALRHSKSKEVE